MVEEQPKATNFKYLPNGTTFGEGGFLKHGSSKIQNWGRF